MMFKTDLLPGVQQRQIGSRVSQPRAHAASIIGVDTDVSAVRSSTPAGRPHAASRPMVRRRVLNMTDDS